MAGGNVPSLQQILGHASIAVTLVYAHLAPDFLEGGLDRLRVYGRIRQTADPALASISSGAPAKPAARRGFWINTAS